MLFERNAGRQPLPHSHNVHSAEWALNNEDRHTQLFIIERHCGDTQPPPHALPLASELAATARSVNGAAQGRPCPSNPRPGLIPRPPAFPHHPPLIPALHPSPYAPGPASQAPRDSHYYLPQGRVGQSPAPPSPAARPGPHSAPCRSPPASTPHGAGRWRRGGRGVRPNASRSAERRRPRRRGRAARPTFLVRHGGEGERGGGTGLGCARRAAGAPLFSGHGSIVSCPRCVPLRRRAPLRAPTLANRRPPPGRFRQSESGKGRGQGAGERARRSRGREVGEEGGGEAWPKLPWEPPFSGGKGRAARSPRLALKGTAPRGEWGPWRGVRPGVWHCERAALGGWALGQDSGCWPGTPPEHSPTASRLLAANGSL